MSTKHQSSTDPCLHVPRPVQLNSRLINGIGGIWGYAGAYRTMALSSRAVVGAAESTATGKGGSARPEQVIELSEVNLNHDLVAPSARSSGSPI
jgi:hypothetical protein